MGFLGDHEQVLPSPYHMQAYFLFLDLPHFHRNWHEWIQAALMLFNFQVTLAAFRKYYIIDSAQVSSPKDIDEIYSSVMEMRPEHLVGNNEATKKLRLLLNESKKLRKELHRKTPNVTQDNVSKLICSAPS